MAQLVRKIAKRSGFALDSYSLVLYGGCGCKPSAPVIPHGDFE
jgi:Fur family ferric uptake transcriptional regulator